MKIKGVKVRDIKLFNEYVMLTIYQVIFKHLKIDKEIREKVRVVGENSIIQKFQENI